MIIFSQLLHNIKINLKLPWCLMVLQIEYVQKTPVDVTLLSLPFTGIVAGPFIKRYGWRKVAILGSCLSSLGYATSAAAPNVYTLYFTYGVLTG